MTVKYRLIMWISILARLPFAILGGVFEGLELFSRAVRERCDRTNRVIRRTLVG